MEYTHIQKNIQDSPRKLRLVADMVRSMTPGRALEILQFTNRAAALSLSKAIKTAVANTGKDDVAFKSIEINEAMKMRRNRVGTAGRGRSRPYKKRWSHIKIVLTDEVAAVQAGAKMKGVKKRKEAVVKGQSDKGTGGQSEKETENKKGAKV